MSTNADIVRRIFEVFPRDQEALRKGEFQIGEIISDDVEWDASELQLPDLGDGVLHGREGVRRFWSVWLSAWNSVEFEYEIRGAGDSVVVLLDQKMVGTEDFGIPLHYAQVWTFEGGQVVRWKVYLNTDEALNAFGLAA